MNYPEPVQELFDTFEKAGRDLYLVGGAVRDWALGEPVENLDDLDFCTDARPEETARILRDGNFHVYELGAEFGTVGAVVHGPEGEGYPKDCQITTYRSEEYYRRGSRHPSVEFGDTIEQDLGRRDFSINSMALDGRGELVDPYDGRSDLEDGILRVIGDPLETLAEDPLRILRVGRFMSKLGFEPTDELREAAAERAHCIL
ncbi:MAG: CCA tRNA nucleotidyltransferase, partial [Persicimonas sp.]